MSSRLSAKYRSRAGSKQEQMVDELLAHPQKTFTVVEKNDKIFEVATKVQHPAVYIIRCEQYYKIGYTRDSVLKRVESLQIGNPFEIKVVFVVLTPQYKELEGKLHKHFEHRHFRGEWFELMPEDEAEIEKFLKETLWPEK